MVHVDETGKTTFRLRHRTAGPVYLVGDFSAWQTDHLPMRRVSDEEWVLMIRLPPGTYAFRYYANGEWFTDYAAFGVRMNAFKTFDGIVRVPKVKAAPMPRLRVRRTGSRLARSA